MRKRAVFIATLITPVLMFAPQNALEAAEESPFFLQDHGKVRVLRGVDPGKNFEAAKLPEEIDVAPAAAPQPQAEPPRTNAQQEPKFTRQAAIERARGRGITVHRAGVRDVPGPEAGRTRREAIERARRRGIPES